MDHKAASIEAVKTDKIVFEVRPRRRQDGFTLTSDTLLYPLWYTTLNQAVSYARFLTRYEGCQIRLFDAAGELKEIIENDPANSKRTRSALVRLRSRPRNRL